MQDSQCSCFPHTLMLISNNLRAFSPMQNQAGVSMRLTLIASCMSAQYYEGYSAPCIISAVYLHRDKKWGGGGSFPHETSSNLNEKENQLGVCVEKKLRNCWQICHLTLTICTCLIISLKLSFSFFGPLQGSTWVFPPKVFTCPFRLSEFQSLHNVLAQAINCNKTSFRTYFQYIESVIYEDIHVQNVHIWILVHVSCISGKNYAVQSNTCI